MAEENTTTYIKTVNNPPSKKVDYLLLSSTTTKRLSNQDMNLAEHSYELDLQRVRKRDSIATLLSNTGSDILFNTTVNQLLISKY